MRKHLVMITAVVSLALILLGFTGCSVLMPTSHTTNVADQDAGLAVAENFYLFSGSEIGYSFLYPKTREVGFSKEDGAYIYCGEDTAQPYVLVCRIDKRGMSPEKYFKACDKLMLDTFQNVQSTPINEVELGDKTLYLTRYACDGLVIDRYVELYDGFYIQYTAISNEAGALNTELYYAISTLRVNEGAYKGAYSETVSVRRHPDLAMQIDIPDMLEVKELTLGYFSTNENAVMLTVLITEDDDGKAIYNRKDFINRAAESPNFVAGLLGADSAVFTEGQEEHFGDKSFYCYPMEMQEGGAAFQGELCLANAGETGCWLVCYAVRGGCLAFDDTLGLLEDCAKSIDFE